MLLTAVIFGLLGSLHCVGMCGPIAFILPLNRKNPYKKFTQLFLYHFGRLFSYSFIGFLFGWLGKGLFISGLQQQLSVFIGALMIVIVLVPYHILRKYSVSKPLFSIISKLKAKLGTQLKKKSYNALFAIGILNGLLPCGLVYMALFAAIATGSTEKSALYMLLFGVGTIPLMTGAGYLGNFLSIAVRQKIQKVIPVFIVIIGTFFILRGMGLGIPYVSPSDMTLMVKADADCVTP
ncbi:sulfite exporter TauE/SafE family protein [Leptobacterium sp. I13]|uniref:sulfite exporter TauE/SafE family protein n=1 Tax=Leptobacterium meishanense TaxID=3128904 RepID=UPI0030EED1B5